MTKRIHWNEHIDPLDLIKFETTYNSLFTQKMSFGSLFMLAEYESHLVEPISRFAWDNLYHNPQLVIDKIEEEKELLVKERIDSDYLFKLIPAWVNERPARYIHPRLSKQNIFGGTRRKLFEIENPKALSLHISLQNILCLSTWGLTISEFVKLAILGDNESTIKLIKLNKLFVSAKWVSNRIELAQHHQDEQFFKILGNAIQKDTPSLHYHLMKYGTAIILLWFIGFKDLSKTQLYNYMMDKKYIPQEMTQNSFNSIIFRLGIRK